MKDGIYTFDKFLTNNDPITDNTGGRFLSASEVIPKGAALFFNRELPCSPEKYRLAIHGTIRITVQWTGYLLPTIALGIAKQMSAPNIPPPGSGRALDCAVFVVRISVCI